MADYYRVQVQSVRGEHLTCLVTEIYGEDYLIEPSLTLAFGEDEWSHIPAGEETHQATYNVAVTDPRWIEHLTPGGKWETRVWPQDRVPVCEPAWRTSDVLALARGISADIAFDRMPILADALQDAGCTKDRILRHCRSSGPHVRGCWVLDLLLGDQ